MGRDLVVGLRHHGLVLQHCASGRKWHVGLVDHRHSIRVLDVFRFLLVGVEVVHQLGGRYHSRPQRWAPRAGLGRLIRDHLRNLPLALGMVRL